MPFNTAVLAAAKVQHNSTFYMYVTNVGTCIDIKTSAGGIFKKRLVEGLGLDKKGSLVDLSLAMWDKEAEFFPAEAGDVLLVVDAKTAEYNNTMTMTTTMTGCVSVKPDTPQAKELAVVGKQFMDSLHDSGDWEIPPQFAAKLSSSAPE